MEDVIGFVLNGEQHSLSRAEVLTAAARGGPEPDPRPKSFCGT